MFQLFRRKKSDEQSKTVREPEPGVSAAPAPVFPVFTGEPDMELVGRWTDAQMRALRGFELRCRPKIEKADTREAVEQLYQAFFSGEGKTPAGFDGPYTILPHLAEYLAELARHLDGLTNYCDITDWLILSDPDAIHTAIPELVGWTLRCRRMNELVLEAIRPGIFPNHRGYRACSLRTVMVVLEDDRAIRAITREEIAFCREMGISFCTLLTDHSIYDFTKQKERTISCHEYAGSVDDAATYGNWYLT